MKPTPKQLKFCQEYLIDLNATQAAIRAGYSPKTASEQGTRLLGNVKVQTYIQEKQKNKAAELDITQTMVLQELVKIAFGDVKNYFDENGRLININELQGNISASIKSVTVQQEKIKMEGEIMVEESVKKIESYDKLKAIDTINRMLGFYAKDNEQKKEDHGFGFFLMQSNQIDE